MADEVEKPEDKPAVTWGPVAAIGVTLLTFFGGQIIGLLLFVIGMAAFSGSPVEATFDRLANTDTGTLYQFYSVLTVEAVTVLMLYIFLRGRKASFRSLGLMNFHVFDIVRALLGFGVYFLLYFMAVLAAKAVFPALDTEQAQELGFDTSVQGKALLPIFVSLVVLPPLVEEILTRGFLYTGLRTKLKPIVATIITSVLFAGAHLQWGSEAPLLWIAAIDTFVLSLVLCYLRESTGRLWASIGLHAIKNGIAFMALFVFKVT